MQYINFRKTDDKNIVLADGLSANEEFYISKLEEQIADIQSRIDNIPAVISKADITDVQVIDLIDDFNEQIPSADDLIVERAHLENLLWKCQNIKETETKHGAGI